MPANLLLLPMELWAGCGIAGDHLFCNGNTAGAIAEGYDARYVEFTF